MTQTCCTGLDFKSCRTSDESSNIIGHAQKQHIFIKSCQPQYLSRNAAPVTSSGRKRRLGFSLNVQFNSSSVTPRTNFSSNKSQNYFLIINSQNSGKKINYVTVYPVKTFTLSKEIQSENQLEQGRALKMKILWTVSNKYVCSNGAQTEDSLALFILHALFRPKYQGNIFKRSSTHIDNLRYSACMQQG